MMDKPIIPSMGSPTWATRMVDAALKGELVKSAWARQRPREQKTKPTSRFTNSSSFIQTIRPLAERAASFLGIDPDILVAQASLETGFGKHMTGKNLFNIKATPNWKGQKATVNTTEYYQGTPVKVADSFRAYRSFEDSFRDYVSLVATSPRYRQALRHNGDAYTYIKGLQLGGYATDPKYADKVYSIYRGLKSI